MVGAGIPALGRADPGATPEPGCLRPRRPTNGDPAPVDEPAGLVPPLTAGLEKLDVSSPEFDAAEERLDEARTGSSSASARSPRTPPATGGSSDGREAVLTDQVERAQRRVASFGKQVRRLRGELRNLAVASYVSGRELEGFGALVEVDAQRHNDLRSQAVMVDTVNADLSDTSG